MTKKKSKGSQKPKFMITYLCRGCGVDFARSELAKPKCFYCGKTEAFVIKKEKLTPEVMAARMKLVADRMMKNLKAAFKISNGLEDEVPRGKMINALFKGEKLRKDIHKLKPKKSKN